MKDVRFTRSRLLTTTVLPMAVVAALGLSTPASADHHEGGACNPCAASCSACNPCGAACAACNPCNPCAAGACNPCNPCAGSDY